MQNINMPFLPFALLISPIKPNAMIFLKTQLVFNSNLNSHNMMRAILDK